MPTPQPALFSKMLTSDHHDAILICDMRACEPLEECAGRVIRVGVWSSGTTVVSFGGQRESGAQRSHCFTSQLGVEFRRACSSLVASRVVTNLTASGMASAAHVAHGASSGSTPPHGPSGYILSYGVCYTGVFYKGEALDALPTCPPSAVAAHGAFVSKCGFLPAFPPTLDDGVTKSCMVEDVRRVAATIASHDVVVLHFSGHGLGMDNTSCVVDGAGGVVSVRKLQAVFAETVMDRGLRDVAFVVILDCCRTLSTGMPPRLTWCRRLMVVG